MKMEQCSMAAYFAKITAAPRGQGGDDFGHSAEKPRFDFARRNFPVPPDPDL